MESARHVVDIIGMVLILKKSRPRDWALDCFEGDMLAVGMNDLRLACTKLDRGALWDWEWLCKADPRLIK